MASLDPDALRRARLNAGLTQHELAVLIGAAGGERISLWELGAAQPRPSSITKLAAVLNIDSAALLDDVQPDLRGLRQRRGLSSQQVAERLNISVATYRRWEAGHHRSAISNPDVAVLARLLRVSRRDLRQVLEAPAQPADRPRMPRQPPNQTR